MKIFVLNTNLFPEKEAVEDALAQLGSDHEVTRCDTDSELTDDDWDNAMLALTSADRIITL
ncbi:MAG: hypothetical protein GY794_26210 [bacterium]|nr:hypothetical protein [bacterium]